jgi:NAD(P)-dependent dehydrogenase (short-subunit alcohol dehydrogenase family)
VSETGPASGVSVIVGGGRGIGLALAQAQLRDDTLSRLVVTHRPGRSSSGLEELALRHPDRVKMLELDTTAPASLAHFARHLADLEGRVDTCIHAAGLLHDENVFPEKSLEQCEPASLMRLFEVNSIGPLMVARALLAAQPRQQTFKFVALSAMVGSIGDNRLGGWYGYRASKAALNQFIKTLANECRTRFPRAAIMAIHPGTTDTQLSRPFQRNVPSERLYTPAQTAMRILNVIENADRKSSGRFFNWDGSEIPW